MSVLTFIPYVMSLGHYEVPSILNKREAVAE